MTEREAELEAALKLLWSEVTGAFLVSDPTEAKSSAFYKVDRELRRLGILPAVK